jgi:hypothetical protein
MLLLAFPAAMFVKILAIVTLSALFPLVGFYLDWRANKRRYQTKSKA